MIPVEQPPGAVPSSLPGPAPAVLIVDDHGPSRALARVAVEPLGAHVLEADSAQAAWQVLAGVLPDVILLDLMMPEVDGITFARLLRADHRLSEVPILMITASSDRTERIAALSAGVDDFITKPLDRIELRARVATVCRVGRFRKLVEERQRAASLATLAPIGVLVIDAVTSALHVANERARQFLPNLRDGEPLLARLEPSAAEQLRAQLGAASQNAEPVSMRWSLGNSGRHYDVAVGRIPWSGAPALQLVLTDVTALHHAQERLQSQDRLDAVGRLAASVAHDFATVLQVCQLHLHAARREPLTGPLDAALTDIDEALHRGGLMTQNLLRFCRRPDTPAASGSCDAADVLRGLERLLHRLSPISIETTVRVPDYPVPVPVAAHELEQAIVNLVSNASDAIEVSGRIDVTLSLRDGVAQLAVRDTGHGMPPEVMRRIGEPFFTTKAEGQGTGLGLWTVRRVLDATRGTMDVHSDVGIGTEVRLSFPAPSVASP